MILALNVGYYNTKVKDINGREIHATRVQEGGDGSKTLVIEDTSYEIGVGNRDITDKQGNDVYKICTHYNILKYSNSSSMELVVALPVNKFLDRSYREHFRHGLIGEYTGVVNGVNRLARVTNCTVFAEGAAAYLPYKHIFKNKVMGVIDIGGNTVNAMIYSYGELQKDTITTLDTGVIKLERTLIDELNIKRGWNVQEYELREILEYNEASEVVDKLANKHIKDIKQMLLEKKWNLDRISLFFTGGGSLYLKKYIESNFKKAIISNNALWDNVEGLWLAGGVVYAKNN